MLARMDAVAHNRLKILLPVLLAIGAVFLVLASDVADADDFSRWLEGFRAEALADGISANTLEKAFADIQGPLLSVLELDRRQPEAVQTSAEYLAARVTAPQVESGKRMLRRHETVLKDVELTYAVQPRFLVALWGMETGYGRNTGNFSVIHVLATLAHDGRRSRYFRNELLQALRLLDNGYIPLERMRGSWAGAMGHCQFMPTTFLLHAVDADGDGRIDLWGSVPDALSSAANYLAREGWLNDQTWGCRVDLPAGFDYSFAGLDKGLPLASWQDMGVRRLDGGGLPQQNFNASLVLPDGPNGQAYLVYDNFRVLMRWNRSVSFAIAVGTLADRIGAR